MLFLTVFFFFFFLNELQVMGKLMKEHKTEMDGKLAQRLVTAKLKGE